MALTALGVLLDSYLDQTERLLNESKRDWKSSPRIGTSPQYRQPNYYVQPERLCGGQQPNFYDQPERLSGGQQHNGGQPATPTDKAKIIEDIDGSLDILNYLLELTGIAKAKHEELSRHLAEISHILSMTSRDYIDITNSQQNPQ